MANNGNGKKKNWTKRIIWTLILAGVLAGAGYGVRAALKPDNKIDPSKIASVERGNIARSVVATGKIEPRAVVEVKSKASGIVKKILVEYGDTVRQGQVLAELDKEELQARLRVQSIREPLTGLFNRRYLEESLARELARCERRHMPLGLMMLDLDHFKRFNDLHGHAGGDALLSEFGRLLQALSRDEDIACRYGGEEFTLILPEATDHRRRRAPKRSVPAWKACG